MQTGGPNVSVKPLRGHIPLCHRLRDKGHLRSQSNNRNGDTPRKRARCPSSSLQVFQSLLLKTLCPSWEEGPGQVPFVVVSIARG